MKHTRMASTHRPVAALRPGRRSVIALAIMVLSVAGLWVNQRGKPARVALAASASVARRVGHPAHRELFPGQGTSLADTRRAIVLHPRSRPAVRGRAYPFRLYTHCGANYAVDFNHTFWDLTDKRWADRGYPHGVAPHAGLDDPFQLGTMTLIDANHARFDFMLRAGALPGVRGQQHIHFTRHRGRKVVPFFCD
jgi:hypothetical protein